MSLDLVSIDETCEIINGGSWNQTEYTLDGVKVIKVSNLINDGIDESNLNFLPKEALTKYNKNILYAYDLVVTTVGSHPQLKASAAGRGFLIPKKYEGSLLNQNAICIRTKNENILHNKYLAYLGRSFIFRHYIQQGGRGAANQMRIPISVIKKFKFNILPLKIQKRIADILSAYDDLIENNLKRIKLLEQAAQNIYKEWFVNLRFPGHENKPINEETGLPEGWKNLNFSDVAKFSQGLQVGTKKQNSIKQDGQKRFIRIVDVTQGGQEPRYVDCINSKYEVEKKDLFMIRYGSPKVVMGYEGVIANNFFKIKILKGVNMNNNYLYAFLNRDEITKTLMNYSSSATMPAISFKRISKMQILYPDFEIQEKYSKLMDANWALFFTLNQQNQKLKAARDILLPRLMNRTIKV